MDYCCIWDVSVCSEMISATAELHWEGVFLFSKWGLLSFLKL